MDKHSDRGDRFGDYPESHRNMHSATSSWSFDDPVPHHDRGFDNYNGGFTGNGHHGNHHHHHRRQHHHYNFSSETNDSIGSGGEVGSGNSVPFSGRKRLFSDSGQGNSSDYIDGGSYVKLYVGGIPRSVTERDIRFLFGKHGNVVEVVLLKDKKTTQQQVCCFVKYAKVEEADQAIGALHNQHTFPGGMLPIRVKYADGERERLGGSETTFFKLYVGCLNKQASKWEIEEVFSPYGLIEDVYIVRDEMKQSRGCAFLQFSHRDMAVAAINALNGTYMMRGCDQPLIVRFADPKKPKAGESRGNSKFGGSAFGPCSQESVARQAPYVSDPMGRHMLPNALHPSSQSGSEPITVSCTSTALEPVLPSTIPSALAVPLSFETADPPDCDWSEHTCPDGYKYYYNCITCESRWEKPEVYTFYEQQLQKRKQQQHPPCQHLHSLSHPQFPSTQQVPQKQQVHLQTQLSHQQLQQPSLSAPELDVHIQAATSPVVAPACV